MKISPAWLLIALASILCACDDQSEQMGRMAVFSQMVIKTSGAGSVQIAPGVYDAEVDYLLGDSTDAPVTGEPIGGGGAQISAPPQARIAITYQDHLVETRITKNMNAFGPPDSFQRLGYEASVLIKGNVFDIPQEWDAGTRIGQDTEISFLAQNGQCLAQLHAVSRNDAETGNDITDVPAGCLPLGKPNDPLAWTVGGSNGVRVLDASTLNASSPGKKHKHSF